RRAAASGQRSAPTLPRSLDAEKSFGQHRASLKITRALISVSNKKGIASFARALEKQGVDIISTGGTAELLRKEGVPVREILRFTKRRPRNAASNRSILSS